jgi:SAM-dependent methyltransferase
MRTLATPWSSKQGPLSWVLKQTNAALRDQNAAQSAKTLLNGAGLPTHPDHPKNWDTFLALFHAIANTEPFEAILDAGAERYSVFLPALRQLGYTDLTGVNLTYGAPEDIDGIIFQHGDITGTEFPAQSYAFISCLSVIEHGVDIDAFLSESARLLRAGGHLFLSFDYWEDPVETHGQHAYGVPIRIFTRADVDDMLRSAEKFGLSISGDANFSCEDRVVHWQRFGLRYTFANILLRKAQRSA